MSTHNEFHGVIVRGERVTFVCCDCGLFIKHGEQETQVIYYPCATEPEYEYVHRDGQYLVEREELRPVSVLTIDTDDDLVKFLQETGYVVRASDYADVPLAIGEERD